MGREPDETGLPLLLQGLQRLQGAVRAGVFDGIDRVIVKDLHVVHLQPLQTSLDSIHKLPLSLRNIRRTVPHVLFSRDNHFRSHTQFLDHRPDHLFVASALVSRRRIEMADAKLVRPAQ